LILILLPFFFAPIGGWPGFPFIGLALRLFGFPLGGGVGLLFGAAGLLGGFWLGGALAGGGGLACGGGGLACGGGGLACGGGGLSSDTLSGTGEAGSL
jgi:hypothetical protein